MGADGTNAVKTKSGENGSADTDRANDIAKDIRYYDEAGSKWRIGNELAREKEDCRNFYRGEMRTSHIRLFDSISGVEQIRRDYRERQASTLNKLADSFNAKVFSDNPKQEHALMVKEANDECVKAALALMKSAEEFHALVEKTERTKDPADRHAGAVVKSRIRNLWRYVEDVTLKREFNQNTNQNLDILRRKIRDALDYFTGDKTVSCRGGRLSGSVTLPDSSIADLGDVAAMLKDVKPQE